MRHHTKSSPYRGLKVHVHDFVYNLQCCVSTYCNPDWFKKRIALISCTIPVWVSRWRPQKTPSVSPPQLAVLSRPPPPPLFPAQRDHNYHHNNNIHRAHLFDACNHSIICDRTRRKVKFMFLKLLLFSGTQMFFSFPSSAYALYW